MSKKVLLDTDTILYAIHHNLSLPSQGYAISIITEIELHSSSKFQEMMPFFKVYKINKVIRKKSKELERRYGFSFYESVICATALIHDNMLLTANRRLSTVSNLNSFLIQSLQ